MKKKRTPKKRVSIYEYLITFPDRLYPFSFRARGKNVRGLASYNHELALALKRYGEGHFGYKLVAYRETFHFIGSILFIIFAAGISSTFFGSDVALYVLLAAALIAITFQEFYVHPRTYGQLLPKGVIDWIAWTLPIALYVFTYMH